MRQGQSPIPEVEASVEATASLLTAPHMLKGTDLKMKRPLNPSLGEDAPFHFLSVGVKMRGLDEHLAVPESR